jgi:hypothetical protein
MQTKINIRVYKRNEIGTIFIWNTDPLSPELRKQPNYEVQYDSGIGNPWLKPEIQMPDVQRMGRVIDGQTDTIMVMHTSSFTEKTRFLFRLSFGPKEEFSTVLDVQPRNEYQGHFKVERAVLPDGHVKYVVPATVVKLDDNVRQEIKNIVKEAISEK